MSSEYTAPPLAGYPSNFHDNEPITTRPRIWPLITIAVLVCMLILVTVSLLLVNKNTYDELESTKATLSQAQTDLTNTQGQLTQAQSDVTTWKDVSESWRQCGLSLLETLDSTVNEGLLGGLAPLGAASAVCEQASTKQSATGGSFA